VLLELVIENYAVVDRLRVRFHPGLNLLTGETGSGKSIVVDALGLLFGGRASADMIRSGSDRARISGIFTVPDLGKLDLAVEEFVVGKPTHDLFCVAVVHPSPLTVAQSAAS